MIFEKDVQFLGVSVNESGFHVYDFLDLESNLPFSIFSTTKLENYEKLKQYQVCKTNFSLVRVNTKNNGLSWKIKNA